MCFSYYDVLGVQYPCMCASWVLVTSRECHSVSNHQQFACSLNNYVMLTKMETSKLCITGLLWEEFHGNRGTPWQMVSNVESVSMLWCPHGMSWLRPLCQCSCATGTSQAPIDHARCRQANRLLSNGSTLVPCTTPQWYAFILACMHGDPVKVGPSKHAMTS